MEGKNRHVIAYKELESPRGLAVDYEAGLLFWTDWGHYRKIERSHMDGESRQRIVTSNLGWPNGLSLDLKTKRIYWVDAQLKTIDSCDYTGNQRKLIMSALHHPYALAMTDDYIYWTDWKSKALHMTERRNITAKREIMTNIDGLMDIKVIMVSILKLRIENRSKLDWMENIIQRCKLASNYPLWIQNKRMKGIPEFLSR